MFKFILAAVVSVFGFASVGLAQMQCDVPHQGAWLLETEQTTTVAGAGAGPQSGTFELAVKGCGESITALGMGSNETGQTKVFTRNGDQFSHVTTYKGFPITINLNMLNPREMTAQWTLTGWASTPGKITFQPDNLQIPRDPRCECQPFIDRLKEGISDNDSFIQKYGQLSNRPSGLDPSLAWTSDVSEALLDLQIGLEAVLSKEVTLSKAVKTLNGMQGGDKRIREENINAEIQRQAKPDNDDGSVSSSSAAGTDVRTCEIKWTQKAKGCGADIIDMSTLAHEEVHEKACHYHNDKFNKWNFADGSPEPPKYITFSDKPANLAPEEIKAYKTANNYIRTTYAQMCGKPLK